LGTITPETASDDHESARADMPSPTRLRDPRCVRKRQHHQQRLREPLRDRGKRSYVGWLEGRDVGLQGAGASRIGADTSAWERRGCGRSGCRARGGPTQPERPTPGPSRCLAYRRGRLACWRLEPVHRLTVTVP
jgi:hypothetical protein